MYVLSIAWCLFVDGGRVDICFCEMISLVCDKNKSAFCCRFLVVASSFGDRPFLWFFGSF